MSQQRWTIDVCEHGDAERKAPDSKLPNVAVKLYRDGVWIATFHPVETPRPGIQICSDYLDLRGTLYLPDAFPDIEWPGPSLVILQLPAPETSH